MLSVQFMLKISVPNTNLPLSVWHTVVSLGINAKSVTKRGKRSGTRIRRNRHRLATVVCHRSSIPVRISARRLMPSKRNGNTSPSALLSLTSRTPSCCPIFNRNSANCLTITMLNCRSVANKSLSIADLVTTLGTDIMAITETWLGINSTGLVLRELVPTGYNIFHISRSNGRRGGGVALMFKTNLKLYQISDRTTNNYTQFELLHSRMEVSNQCIDVFVEYRPPPSTKNCLTTAKFFDEWTIFLENLASQTRETVITGDFNFHVDDLCNNPEARKFINLVERYGFKQHVTGPTHRAGHTLDLLILRESSTLLHGSISVFDPCLTDHNGNKVLDHLAVSANLNLVKQTHGKKTLKFRRFSSINMSEFMSDLRIALHEISNFQDLKSTLATYIASCKDTIDAHAPIQTKIINIRPNTAWYTNQLRQAKSLRRKRERIWRKTRLEVHRIMFKDQCEVVGKLLWEAKRNYYTKMLANTPRNQQKLYAAARQIFGFASDRTPHCNWVDSNTPNAFNEYFISKVRKLKASITSSLTTNPIDDPINSDVPFLGCPLTQFFPATVEEVRAIIQRSSSSTSGADPFPTTMIKQCLPVLLPVITKIINCSMTEGVFPEHFKEALVTPLLKPGKTSRSDMCNYRPISQLPFVSKVLENIVASRVRLHLDEHNLFDEYQSAYRPAHSTETALIKIHHDISEALDRGSIVAMVMLDLSAAFDMVDHEILIKRLHVSYGFCDTVLSWFQSYLTGRTQRVCIGNHTSTSLPVAHGVPQGSVLGPLLYSLYCMSVGNICRKHNLSYHCYADDIQIYLTIDRNDNLSMKIANIDACIAELKSWMTINLLKLNPGKTEFIMFHTRLSPSLPSSSSGILHECTLSSNVKNLGVHFDSTISMSRHTDSIVKSCYFHLRNIGKIRRYLSPESCKILVQALVISRLDYCNALLYSLPDYVLSRLQRIQNHAARLICCVPKRASITPVLMSLHWLPVIYRIKFKILMLVFKSLHGLAPPYLQRLINTYNPPRSLRSQSKLLLAAPEYRTSTYGLRMFTVAAYVLWNGLPQNLRDTTNLSEFKGQLKTHFFRLAYDQF